MIALVLYMLNLEPAAPQRACHDIGPRLDGTTVTVCAGQVVAVRDGLGNRRTWDPRTNTVTVRAPGRAPLVLGYSR